MKNMFHNNTIQFGLPFLILVLVGMVAAQPLLTYGLPMGSDTIYHVQRVASLARSLQQGVIYPRWSPDLAYGFGFPIFNYYAPLSYYLAVAFMRLALSPVQAVTVLAVVLFVIQALGVWLWLRLEFDELSAFWGTVTYTLASYTVSNLTGRGALAEHLALSLLPFVGWGICSLSRTTHPFWFAFVATATAALLLSHNVSAVFLMGFVFIYAGYSSLIHKNLLSLLALGLGAVLTAFFWIPVIAEREFVQMKLLHSVGWSDYRDHFLSLRAHFAWPEPIDPLLAFQPHGPELNGIVVVISLVGATVQGIWFLRRRDERVILILMTMGIFIGALFMTHTVSQPIWEWIEPLKFLQFPWRFYCLVMVCLSVLFAAAAQVIARLLHYRPVILTLLSGCLIGFSGAYIYVRQIPLEVIPTDFDVTPAGIARFERSTTYLGTTTAGEYLPTAVLQKPPFDLSIFAGPTVTEYTSASRLAHEMLPEYIRIEQETYTPYCYVLRVSTPHSSEVTFKTFYFPGWKAYVDGVESPIIPSQPYGLITVPVAAGEHEIVVTFESTPLRNMAKIISYCGFLTLGIVTGLGFYHRRKAPVLMPSSTSTSYSDIQITSSNPSINWYGLIAAACITLAVKTLWVDQGATPFAFTRFDGITVKDLQTTVQKRFGEGFVLIGADVPDRLDPMREDMRVTLYWRITQLLNDEYSTSIHVVDAQGFLVGQSDNQHPGGYPVTEWSVGQYGRDEHTIRIYQGTPPGLYRVVVGAYPYGQPESLLNIYNYLGEPIGTEAEIGYLEILPSQWPDNPEILDVEYPRQMHGEHELGLLGFNQPVKEARPGDNVPFIFYWKANGDLRKRQQVSLHFLDTQGQIAAHTKFDPVAGYSTALWKQGEVWRGTHRIVIPPQLDSGTYQLQLVYAELGQVELEPLTITAPQRIFEEPDLGVSELVQFRDAGEIVRVAIPEMAQAGEEITVMLVWHVTHETKHIYKVFVHLLDEEGKFVVGHDSEPVNWERPTTGWLSGEYLVDEHRIRLPEHSPMRYRLRVGLYDPASNERVLTENGEEFVVLSDIINVVSD